MSELQSFARLVSLACHDLRTPLATVNGFAKTLTRLEDVGEPMARYLELMATAGDQLSELLDDLGTAARIEAGRWEPAAVDVDSLELARSAAAQLEGAEVDVEGTGAAVRVEADTAERALYNLGRCAIRHGGLDRLSLAVDAGAVGFSPIPPDAAPILLGESLRDLGAAVAGRVIRAHGGSVELEGEALLVRLPLAMSSAS